MIYISAGFSLPILEMFLDKLTKFHPLNVTTSTLLSDLNSPEVEVDPHQHQEEVELPEVRSERRGERRRSPEPNIQFVQNILRETREMMRNQSNRANATNIYNRGNNYKFNRGNNYNRTTTTNNSNRAPSTNNSNSTTATNNNTGGGKGRGKPRKE